MRRPRPRPKPTARKSRRRREAAPGQPAPDGRDRPGEPPLKVLPTVRLTGGRVVVGPFAVPNVRLQPLY